jgi:hypothetical protein
MIVFALYFMMANSHGCASLLKCLVGLGYHLVLGIPQPWSFPLHITSQLLLEFFLKLNTLVLIYLMIHKYQYSPKIQSLSQSLLVMLIVGQISYHSYDFNVINLILIVC